MRNNYNQGTAQPRRVDSVPRVSEVTGGQMDQNGVYRANRQQAPAAPQRQGKGAAQPRQAKQPKPARPAAPAPAREPESGAPLNGLLLPIIAGALAVVGTLLLVVGVFLLKDPEPRVVTDTPSQSISRQDTDGEEPKDTTPAGEENQSAEPAEGDDSQPADGEESQPAEGDGSQPADGEDGQPADDSADSQDTASTDAQPADEGDGDQPQAHGKVRPLTSVQFGPAEDSTAADGEDEGLVDTTPSEPSGEGEPDSSAAEPSEEEPGNDAAEPSSDGEPAQQDDTEPAQEGDTEPALEGDTEPALEGDAAPEEQPEAPAPDRTDRQEEGGINIVKLVVTLLGMLMLLAGAVLGIVSNLLQRRELTESQERAASLEREIADMKARTREPTTEEKLRYAFQQIPVLTEAQSNAMMREAAAQTTAHRNVQPPIQQNRPAAPVDPVEKSNAYYNSLLAGGAQKATQAMLGNPEYLGASIDIANSLNAYQAGQRAAYHVIQVEKDPNAPYLTCVKGGSPVALYPNPYAVQYLGIAKLQSMQFILEAFRVVARGAEITPQTLDGLDGLQIRRVEGAAMDARGIVTRKGVIELG